MTLSVGHITYANCAPFFHYLPQLGFSGRIVPGVPASLNRMLAAGEIDVSPSSSFEYARNWQDYLLLPGHSISASGPVQSVLLFSGVPLERLEGVEIALTGESATSINLLQVLLKEFLLHKEVVCRVPQEPVEDLLAAGRPALLIGDRALRAAGSCPAGCRIYDLAALWWEYTGLPFVFALWILRREAARDKRQEVLSLLEMLQVSRTRAFASLQGLAAQSPERHWLGVERLTAYWRCMSYDLGSAHFEGLKLFFRLAHKHGLIGEAPPLQFFS